MKYRRPYAAFTLIELLTVIAIIGIIAALVGPTVGRFRKGDALLAATRQLQDAVARARQLAISGHTTVYMVFVPTSFWQDVAYSGNAKLTAADKAAAANLAGKQLVAYNFISLRSVGDQPGQTTPRYLSEWQSLPETAFIPTWKFALSTNQFMQIFDVSSQPLFRVAGFATNTDLPFPLVNTEPYTVPAHRYVGLPCITFNYLGQLVAPDGSPLGRDEFIPLAHGSVLYSRDANKVPTLAPPSVQESPPGNSTNAYQLIRIDWLTGRARLEHQVIQ